MVFLAQIGDAFLCRLAFRLLPPPSSGPGVDGQIDITALESTDAWLWRQKGLVTGRVELRDGSG